MLRVFRPWFLESSGKLHEEDPICVPVLQVSNSEARAVNPRSPGSPEPVVLKALPRLAWSYVSSFTCASPPPCHPPALQPLRPHSPPAPRLCTQVLHLEHPSDSCLSSEPAPMPPPLCSFPGTVPSPPPAIFPVRKAVSLVFLVAQF